MDADKTFACDICGKSFNHKSNMTVHKRIHTGEKPFQCDLCDKAFTENGKLTRHKKYIQVLDHMHVSYVKRLFSQIMS